MDKQTLIGDILTFLSAKHLSPRRFALDCGVDVASFYRFLKEPERTLQSDAIFRIWTAIYGSRRPKILRHASPAPAVAQEKRPQTMPRRDVFNEAPFEDVPF